MDEIAGGTSGDDHIEHIEPDKILACWAKGMSLGQIARETRLSVGVIKRELKLKQKELVAQRGGGYG